MTDPYKIPKLRWPVDLEVQEIEGEHVLIIRDPLGISPSPLVLKAPIAPVIALFDGNNSAEAILQRFTPQGLTQSLLDEIITILEAHLLMESPAFAKAASDIKQNFATASVRAAANLAPVWGTKPQELSKLVDGFMANDSSVTAQKPTLSTTNMLGLIAPHIDYQRGGISYGLTYRHLANQNHTTYILFGIAHQYSPGLFHLTKKHFETPLGLVETDIDFVTQLATKFGNKRSFEDEFLHKQEHSLELQLPFLLRSKPSTNGNLNSKIIPFLVGSFHEMLAKEKEPSDLEEYQSFIGALTETTRQALNNGSRICILAGVDMAHIGQAFGDTGKLTDEFLQKIATRDRTYLDCIHAQDKSTLFHHMAEDQNARRVCGFPSLYTMIDLMDRLGWRYNAQEFDYRQAVDRSTDCAVTFAGVGLYE